MSISDISAIQKVVIRAPNWIGDTVMAVPAVMALRDVLPGVEITVCARTPSSLLWRYNPAVDEVLELEGRGVLREASSLRRGGYDAAVLLTNSFGTALAARLAGIPCRLGYARHWRGALLNPRVGHQGRFGALHQAEQYLALAGRLGTVRGKREARVWAGEEAEREASRLLGEGGYEAGGFTVGLCPGASYGPAKRWPASKFIELAERFARERGARIVVFAGPAEAPLGCEVARSISAAPIDLSGKTSLLVLSAAMKRCDVIVSNDTGTMHLASASGVPVVGIFGSTEPARTSPLGPHAIVHGDIHCSPCFRRRCRRGLNYECMEKISVDEVYEATVGLVMNDETKIPMKVTSYKIQDTNKHQ